MSEFSNNFFRDLPPRERRYDVPVVDQLVFCVFPNGVKTWVHIYPFEEFTRRRTIGLYPDMRYEQVQEALAASRRIVDLDSDHEKRRVQEVRRSRGLRNIGLTFVAAAAGVAVSVLVARTLQGEVATMEPPLPLPSFEMPSPVTTQPDPDSVAVQTDSLAPPGTDSPQTAVAQSGPYLVTTPVDPAENDEEAASPTETESVTIQPDPATGREGSLEDRVAIETREDLVIAQLDAPETDSEEVSPDEPDETAPDESVVSGDVDSDSTPSPVVADEPEPAGEQKSTVTSDTPAASSNVRRALLTNGIDGHEPVNTLQGTIGVDPGNLRTIFFFTELKGLGGERIIHRWRHMGTTIAEVPFNVRADGRWRVYSSKRISADQFGSWTVEVVSSDGVVLSTLAFEVETNPAN